MGHQVEREAKLLLAREGLALPEDAPRTRIRQAYFLSGPATIRIRAYDEGPFEVTFKFERDGDGRDEFDLEPGDQGPRLYELALAHGFPEVTKTRVEVPAEGPGLEGLTWEVDVFEGRYDFLTLAELEYPGPERPAGLEARPSWYPAGPWPVDVSDHLSFRNSRLVSMDADGVAAVRREFEELLAGASP